MSRLLLLVWLIAGAIGVQAAPLDEVKQLVADGHWRQARAEIVGELASTNLTYAEREDFLFQGDRMRRIRRDFSQTRAQVFVAARKLAPTITGDEFENWEKAGSVEFMDIDGTRWYLGEAARNLFRINSAARALLTKQGYDSLYDPPDYGLAEIREVLTNYDKTTQICNTPRSWRVTYQVSVKPDIVPAGETVRAWLPFPHPLNRQSNIRLVATEPARRILASTNDALGSVYLEEPAVGGRATVFKEEFEYTGRAFYEPIDPARVTPVDTHDPALAPFLGERPPNIVFTDKIKRLSAQIVGTETNPYLKARRIFQWVFDHVTWASAREYCTLDCLPDYALAHGHGDCGIQAMTFMTFCRYNGIPAHWETGWVCGLSNDMHDWCEIYLAPYGWVPVDVTFGLIDSPVDRERWFYLGGMDGFRLVVNGDFGQPLYPEKTHYRSEIVDFQRGEIEWRGGNLYFDQWDWNFDEREIHPASGSPQP